MSSDGSYQLIANQSDIETDPLYSEISRFAHFYSVGGRAIHSAAQIGGKFCKVGIIVRVLLISGSDGMHEGRCSMTKYGAPWKSLVLGTWCSTNSDSLSFHFHSLFCGAPWQNLVQRGNRWCSSPPWCTPPTRFAFSYAIMARPSQSVVLVSWSQFTGGGWWPVCRLFIYLVQGTWCSYLVGEPSDGIVGKGGKYAIAEEDRRQNLNCNLEEKLQRGIYKESVYRMTVSKKKQREACTTSLFTHGQSQGLQSLKKKVR